MKDIGYVFCIYLIDFVKLWIFLSGIMFFQPVKKKVYYIVVGAIEILILFISGLFYKDYSDMITILLTIMVLFTICFLLKGSFKKKLANSLLAYGLILFLDACIFGVVNMTGQEVRYDLSFRLFYNIIIIAILSCIVTIRKHKRSTIQQVSISRRISALLFAGVGTGSFILTALLIRSNNKVTERARIAMIFVTIIVVITYCAACLMMIFITESRDNYKALSKINESIIESQQQYYLLVQEKQQEMRSIRHEMKNHLSCIRGLYKADKYKEMEQYINQVIEASDVSEDLFDTGNDIVNAILNDVQSRYRRNQIEIRLEGGFPEKLSVSPMDLCVIFANTITNAVEAIQRMERAQNHIDYIDVKISSYKDDLYIDIKNPVGNNVDFYNGKLITSKKDKSIHGFGVKNVIQRVEKYFGTIHFRCENNQFYVEIFMKNRA